MKEFSSFSVDHIPRDKRLKRGIYLLGILVFTVGGLYLSIAYRQGLWQISASFITSKQSHPKWIDHWIYWMFQPLYIILHGIVALTFMIIPRKPIALKIISVHAMLYLTVKYLIVILKDNRLVFDDSIDLDKTRCTCSFGFPSCQAAESTFLVCVYFYEVLINSRSKYSENMKAFLKFMCFLLIATMQASKFYLSLHTFSQIMAGTCLGLLTFFGSLVFEDHLNHFFSCCFFGRRKQMSALIFAAVSITVLNMSLWLFYLEDTVKNFKSFTSARCFSCFRLDLMEIRKNSTAAFQYYLLFFGVVLGIFLLSPSSKEGNMDTIGKNFSCKGILRLLVMGLLHAPLWILRLPMAQQSTVGQVLVLYSVVYLTVGILISYCFTIICRKLNLTLPGDIQSSESPRMTTFSRTSNEANDLSWQDDLK